MRGTLPGYYTPTEADFKNLWENSLFVFDANILLNLYRYSPKTSSAIIKILKKVSDRLWIPNQTALDFHNNRLNVQDQQVKAYNDIQANIKEMQDNIGKTLQSDRHPFIKDSNNLLENAKVSLKAIEIELVKRKEEYISSYSKSDSEDNILQEITALFTGKTGKEYSRDRLENLYEDGKIRYERSIPPGYKDVSKGDGIRKYGDLIIWFQTIDKAKETKNPIIFVTDDKKDDWWRVHKGKTLGPRPELIHEMFSKAKVQFYMYNIDLFMEFAEKYLDEKVKEEAIHEARDMRKRKEEHKNMLSNLARLAQQQQKTLLSSGIAEAFQRAAQQVPLSSGIAEAFQRAAQQVPLSPGIAEALSRAVQIQQVPLSPGIAEALSQAVQKQQVLHSLGFTSGEQHAKPHISEDTKDDESTEDEDSEE